jgi:hypothetical protein
MAMTGRVLRLAVGAGLATWVAATIAAPALPALCKMAALLVLALAIWQPRWGLVAVTALAPAGPLLATSPIRAAELLAWSLVAGWCLSAWRRRGDAAWPRTVIVPLTLYAAALAASWMALAIGGAAGVLPSALPRFVLSLLQGNHLIVSSPEPETWTLLQSLAGLAVFGVSIGIVRSDPGSLRHVGYAIVASTTVLAAATIADVARQAVQAASVADFLRRYVEGERFSFPLRDVNAAGSLYAMAAVIAAGYAWPKPSTRALSLLAVVVLAPAIWLTGSRSAYLAIGAGAAVLAAVRLRWQPTRAHVAVGAALFVAAIVAAGSLVDPQSEVEGSAGQSANLRSQFLVTSTRMFASEPLSGVGVGQYFRRSEDFLTPELRDLYGNENAHNYFAQQFAELGLVGGLLFIWLIGVVLSYGWRAVLQAGDDVAFEATFAASTAYVLTCATGHPLLVPEAALPFWAVFGAVAASSSTRSATAPAVRFAAIAATLLLVGILGRSAIAYARPSEQPPEQGFHQMETTRDGAQFRWMTRHAVTYIPSEPGFLRLRLRAPGWPAAGPVMLETWIGGQFVNRHEVPADASTTWDVPARPTPGGDFRRVDFRVNQEWFEEVRLGHRVARRPVSLMVEQLTFLPLR